MVARIFLAWRDWRPGAVLSFCPFPFLRLWCKPPGPILTFPRPGLPLLEKPSFHYGKWGIRFLQVTGCPYSEYVSCQRSQKFWERKGRSYNMKDELRGSILWRKFLARLPAENTPHCDCLGPCIMRVIDDKSICMNLDSLLKVVYKFSGSSTRSPSVLG